LKKGLDVGSIQAKLITVHGRVQRVGFRYFVQDAANRLGLKGKVRNCPESTVEIVAEGNAKAIAELIEQVKQGPQLARVERVEAVDIPVDGSYGSFSINKGW
jgi:acylphosphatase